MAGPLACLYPCVHSVLQHARADVIYAIVSTSASGQDTQPERESVEARVICLLERTPEELAAFEARKAASTSPLDAIRQHPKFPDLKAQILEDPARAQQIVKTLAASAPDLAKAIMENRAEFKAMIMEGAKL